MSEQHVSALRQWLQEQLRRFDVAPANPMNDGWVDCAMQHVTRELGRGRVEDNLPPPLTDAVLSAVVAHADVSKDEELQTVSYVVPNSVHGCRAHDKYFLDRRDSIKQVANVAEAQRAGRTMKHVSTKNNKAQEPRPKGLPCRSCCDGKVALLAGGNLDSSKLCPSCVMDFAEEKVDSKIGVSSEVAATLPQYVDAMALDELAAGSNLVRCANVADQQGVAAQCVCVLTPDEHARGLGYNGSVPFVVGGETRRPRVGGTWFEVPKTGFAIRVWSDAVGVTRRLQKQLKVTNKRAGYEVMPPADIKRVSSKVLRRRMATKLTRRLGLDAAVEMGPWLRVQEMAL